MSKRSPLVLDGGEVKLRLEAERTAHKTFVHVDWVRFTCLLRNVVPNFVSVVDDHFPRFGSVTFQDMPEVIQREQIAKTLADFERDHEDPAFIYPMQQAHELAREVCKALGPEFIVHHAIGKGHDFYKYRWSIHRNDTECGWVGFLASSDGPRQKAQSGTIHANIYGSACTFAAHGWNVRLADVVEQHEGKLTRADLALDFFDGMGYDMQEILQQYQAGVMNSGGKKLKCNMVGDWANGAERSFYIGSKESGKQTNIYEKGDQLFGVDAKNPWMRVELRYGNKLRFLPSDMLRRPADFFAGASDWHTNVLARFTEDFAISHVKTNVRLQVESVLAEVSRNVRHALTNCAPTIAVAFQYLGLDEFLEICNWKTTKRPRRLEKFSDFELSRAYSAVFSSAGGLRPSPV